jgi:hypothetical protein
MLLGAFYYGLQFVIEKRDTEKTIYAATTHILVLIGAVSLTYGWSESLPKAMMALTVAGILQLLFVALAKTKSERQRNFATILALGQLAAVIFTFEEPTQMLINVILLAFVAAVIWIKQVRTDGYALLIVALSGVPLIWGQLVADEQFSARLQLLLSFIPFGFQAATIIMYQSQKKRTSDFYPIALQIYAVSAFVISLFTLTSQPYESLFFNILIVFVGVIIAEGVGHKQVATASSASLFVPLLLHIVLAIRYRDEFNRWSATLLWLLLPIGLGHAKLFGVWGTNAYGWMYLIVGLGLVLSRAIARGVFFQSEHVSLASMEKKASQSYLLGYLLAFLITVIFILNSDVSATQGSIMGLILLPIFWYISKTVEKDERFAIALPIISQIILWSALRPSLGSETVNVYLIFSTIVAVLWYAVVRTTISNSGVLVQSLTMSAAATALIAPFAYFVTEELIIAMPLGLLAFSVLVYDICRSRQQSSREWALGIGLGSIWWLMWYFGVVEIQAYAHTLTFLLVSFAYWRHYRGDKQTSDSYITAALCSATIPLVIQVISEDNGSFYGWWLLLEQVAIILIGMGINNKLMIRWGLYVSLGAVLYQLRELGWAALSVLALFIIAVAIRKIQKYGDYS